MEKEAGGIHLELGIDIYTLLYVREVTNKDLLYRTENSTQYSAVPYRGKASTKEWCVYMDHWSTSLHAWKEHNMITQLHANKSCLLKKAHEECLAYKTNRPCSNLRGIQPNNWAPQPSPHIMLTTPCPGRVFLQYLVMASIPAKGAKRVKHVATQNVCNRISGRCLDNPVYNSTWFQP